MSTAELLVKLNAKVSNHHYTPAGFEKITPQDIAHALSAIPGTGPALLARVRYSQQEEFSHQLSQELLARLQEIAKRRRWRNQSPLANLAKLSVSLYCDPQRCTKCKGTRERRWGNRIIVCQHCNGSGWQRYTDVDLANKIGVSDDSWRLTWRTRMDTALEILSTWDSRCLSGFRRVLD